MTDVGTSAVEGLVGRQAELTGVQRFVHALSEGRAASHALLIAGPAGIGKTSLWLSAAASAEQAGYRVLRARPSDTEATFAYAALLDLLRDELGALLPRLPGQQRTTLQRALGLSEEAAPPAPATGDPQLVQAAAANAFLLLASERPLLVAIDDAPWLDQPSAAALQFIARRVGGRPVGFVLTQRAEEDGPAPLGLDNAFPGRPAERLWLEPLSPGALHRLLGERLEMTLPRPLLIRLHELSGGVPFHALEIARALKGKPLPAAGTTMPIPASLRGLLAARARQLPDTARELLLLVAAAGGLEMQAARSLLGQATADSAAGQGLDEALLALDGSRLRAAHPLVASTVYELANPRQRRAAHEQLGGVTVELEARARHRALASTGPDAEIAAELEEAGRRARERGAPEVAAELLRLAGERTPADEPESRDRRTLALAEALHGAADLQAAQPLLDELIRRVPPGRLLGRARILRSEVCWYTTTSAEAVAQLEDGLGEVEGEPDLQAQMHYRLAVFYDYDIARALEHARRAVALLDDGGDPASLASSLMQLFVGEVWLGLPPRPELLERALAIEPPDTGEANTIPGIWWLALDRTEDARDRFRAMLERDRRRGDLSNEADLLTKLAETEALADRFTDARELADAATAAARQQGYEAADPARRIRALVDAYEGRLAQAREVA
ncbi:MAG TPA: AAA family ATPase, partial [Candidatus Limnocylindria bacterium]|nr:AAA family ATPase [Candidatus Limnocylindria bacterium]